MGEIVVVLVNVSCTIAIIFLWKVFLLTSFISSFFGVAWIVLDLPSHFLDLLCYTVVHQLPIWPRTLLKPVFWGVPPPQSHKHTRTGFYCPSFSLMFVLYITWGRMHVITVLIVEKEKVDCSTSVLLKGFSEGSDDSLGKQNTGQRGLQFDQSFSL